MRIGGLALLLTETAHRHHLVILDFPLALMAAYFVSQGTAAVLVQRRGLRQVSLMLALVGLLVWMSYQVITWTDYFSQPVNPEKHTTRLAAAQPLQQVTTPDQFVVSDDLAIPLVAQRLVIPQLADASSGSMGCNLANESLFMQQTSRNGAPIIFWTGRFVRAFPILRLWAATTYVQSEQ